MFKNPVTSAVLGSVLLVSLAATSSIAAEQITVKAGQKTLIYQFGSYEDNCASFQYAKFRDKNTKNGSLVSTRGSFIISKGRCKGKRLKSTDVYYTPKAGFKGKDKARLSFGIPKGIYSDFGLDYTTVTMHITVE